MQDGAELPAAKCEISGLSPLPPQRNPHFALGRARLLLGSFLRVGEQTQGTGRRRGRREAEV